MSQPSVQIVKKPKKKLSTIPHDRPFITFLYRIGGAMAARSAGDLKVVSSSPAIASLIHDDSVLDAHLRAPLSFSVHAQPNVHKTACEG